MMVREDIDDGDDKDDDDDDDAIAERFAGTWSVNAKKRLDDIFELRLLESLIDTNTLHELVNNHDSTL